MSGNVQFYMNLGTIFHLKYLFHGNSFYFFFKVIVDIKIFSTLLFYFILCKKRHYSGEKAANMIVNSLLSDEDNASLNGSNLSSDSYSESAYSGSSETDKDFNNNTFAASQSAYQRENQTSANF